jgi:hypothetical protein
VDSHPVVASQLSFECWFLLLTTLRTLSIPSLASILYILPFQLRADINRFRVQLRLLLTPSIPPRQALLRRDFPELVFTTASLRLQYYLFHQFFTLRSGYPEPAQKQQHLFWKTSRHFFSLFGILRFSASPLSRVDSINSFFTSRARVLITLPSDDAAVIWHSFCFTFRPAAAAAASPPPRLRLFKAVESRHCWNAVLLANRLQISFTASSSSSGQGPLSCSSHRPDPQTRLSTHSDSSASASILFFGRP